MLAFEPRERRGRGAEDAAPASFVCGVELFAQFETVCAHSSEVRAVDQEAPERDERRIRMVLPVVNLFVVKTFVVLRACMAQRVVIRMVGLNQHSARAIAASGASRHLRYQLKRSFRRTKIRQSESRID